jgi:hypothetical protein
LGAGAAVAGINNPLADVRSPFAGVRTTRRSAVSSMFAWMGLLRARVVRGLDPVALLVRGMIGASLSTPADSMALS